MVLYYTYKQKTKIFAQAISELLNLPVTELVSDINKRNAFSFIIKALALTLGKKAYPITNTPASLPAEIYVCSPIWGGRVAAPVKYFLENTNLAQTKVNLILTASTPTDKYKNNAIEYLRNLPSIAGDVFVFQTHDEMPPDKDVMKEQLKDII